eukprot:Nitzschia sp. Nitz4//scaffold154_size52827//7820//9588//NITZ4_006771-RA/size52827-processed-gene-0.53-mRNA-1//-1//CDS//3329537293//7341//frame0
MTEVDTNATTDPIPSDVHDQYASAAASEDVEPGYLVPVGEYWKLPHAKATPDNTVFGFSNRALPLVSVRGLSKLKSTRHTSESSSSIINSEPVSNGRRPALISVQVHKPSRDMALGIGFRVVDGVPMINSINPAGMFAGSPLQPGDTLVRLGDATSILHNSAKELAQYLKESTGNITIAVATKSGASGIAEAVVYKYAASSPIGLSFVNKTGRLQISRIDPKGLLGENSVLKVGDYIEMINSCNVAELDVASTKDILQSTAGFTSIRVRSSVVSSISVNDLTPSIGLSGLDLEEGLVTAEEIHSPRQQGSIPTFDTFGEQPSLLSILTYKTEVDSNLGIELRKIPNNQSEPSKGKLEIAHVSDRGLLSKFPLEVGDVVFAINYRRGYDLTPRRAIESLQSVNSMYLIVHKPHGKPGLVHAIATAPKEVSSDNFQLGMTFRGGGLALLQVGIMHPWCHMMNSILGEGDTLVAINGIPSEHLTPSEAVAIVRRPTEHFAFLARTSRDRGIVLSRRYAASQAVQQVNRSGISDQERDQNKKQACSWDATRGA